MRFWRVEVPFAMPALVWNMMVSMSGGWFFVVASEAITIGNTTVTLPGVGSYIATAIAQRDTTAIGWAIGMMLVVILLYDQLLFRPLVAWADRFRFEQEPGVAPPRSWVLTCAPPIKACRHGSVAPFAAAWRWSYRLRPSMTGFKRRAFDVPARLVDGSLAGSYRWPAAGWRSGMSGNSSCRTWPRPKWQRHSGWER